ncbi:alpha-L-fucosidase [uncultured Alloprevotella sp.]|jgi:F5/8 type C domain protein|uniref:alpha-L-fucosidase n=1 Tax=uncultured Alloprevotella sp. TaxID=1283315 RepID=UPI0028ED1E64|nr:alpha-L-fucosidase [uncultured Alloprevotella sp.]
MKKITYLLSALALSAAPVISSAQSQFSLQSQTLTNSDNEPGPVFPLPTERQLKWNETEFYAFFHYGMNTYTNLEWGNGDEAESIFAPTAAPNPEQWLKAVQAAGMKGGIAVVKHHDGFCLWPTSSTTHSVVKAGNAFGRETNIPRDFAAAAQKLGLKYGFYVSPWDRNSALYGTDKYVKDVFLRQCAELATYGTDQFEMWFDGANGGDGYYGGRKTTISVDRETYYDIPNLRDSIHKVCPNIILWGVGGEARWIGNEAGWAGETNWATENLGYAPERNGMYGTEDGWIWFPGESDAKMTDQGWFWHSNESPLSAERLFQMYLETVGRNATLILNCPPNKAGVLPEADVRVLKQLGTMLKNRLGNDLAKNAHIEVSNTRTAGAHRNYETANLTDGDAKTYWATNDGVNNATITLTWDTPQTVRYVMLQEYIRLGQRIKSFKIETSTDGTTWKAAAPGVTTTTVGYKRIIPLNGSTANSYGNGTSVKAVRITLTDSKACPTLSTLSVF